MALLARGLRVSWDPAGTCCCCCSCWCCSRARARSATVEWRRAAGARWRPTPDFASPDPTTRRGLALGRAASGLALPPSMPRTSRPTRGASRLSWSTSVFCSAVRLGRHRRLSRPRLAGQPTRGGRRVALGLPALGLVAPRLLGQSGRVWRASPCQACLPTEPSRFAPTCGRVGGWVRTRVCAPRRAPALRRECALRPGTARGCTAR